MPNIQTTDHIHTLTTLIYLFNIYINELTQQLEEFTAPGPILLDTVVKFLLFADDLVLMSTTGEGLQEKLNILSNFCKTWALKIN